MHASEAFVNGAASKGRAESAEKEDLFMINTLLSAAVEPAPRSADEQKGHEERKQESATKPGGFKNDPDDASNPNEVRERHLKTIEQTKKVKDGTV